MSIKNILSKIFDWFSSKTIIEIEYEKQEKEKELPDIQKTKDTRNIKINKAGICNFKIPVSVKVRDQIDHCNTVATVNAFVSVNKDIKGINMSRLPIFIQSKQLLSLDLMVNYANEICKICESDNCELVYNFKYFLTKKSPVTENLGAVWYDCKFKVKAGKFLKGREFKYISITAICSTCCPCSKEISNYNAHNQKCYITIDAAITDMVWLEELIEIAENASSCQIYSVLKRPDEKYVTEKMYEHPQFVEDVVRDVVLQLEKNKNIIGYKVTAEADESIHMHRACAEIYTQNWPDI